MSKYLELQQNITSLEECYQTIQSLKKEIVGPSKVEGTKLFTEDEYEAEVAKRRRNKERDEKTMEKIQQEITKYNSLHKQILDAIELEGEWLELSWNVVRKVGDSIEFFQSKAHYYKSQNRDGTGLKAKAISLPLKYIKF